MIIIQLISDMLSHCPPIMTKFELLLVRILFCFSSTRRNAIVLFYTVIRLEMPFVCDIIKVKISKGF